MSFYSVNFSGGMWSNDSGEDPYYSGVYSSLEQAQHFTRLAMIDELKCCGWDCDPDSHELNLENMEFSELEAYYENCMDCVYEINPITCTTPDFQYTIDYRPSGSEHECLGSYSSLEEVKEIVLSKMRKEIASKKHLTDEDLIKKFKKKYDVPFFVTKMKVDSNFFCLIWDGDYDTGYSIANKHKDLKWCLLLNES